MIRLFFSTRPRPLPTLIPRHNVKNATNGENDENESPGPGGRNASERHHHGRIRMQVRPRARRHRLASATQTAPSPILTVPSRIPPGSRPQAPPLPVAAPTTAPARLSRQQSVPPPPAPQPGPVGSQPKLPITVGDDDRTPAATRSRPPYRFRQATAVHGSSSMDRPRPPAGTRSGTASVALCWSGR